ncbi:transducin beta-like protein 3 [Argiope bruennichi]|uniref:Transducin beta-like protein 3 like protein n=1 Tax=Argiope bruennichi TaxID=94029 RepID=A0A8T0FWG6_ARGBR|nr:transducin beta-like protein 3 [Argiope bruennichi]KAF8793900.1 Transducin beta-like protein 3 like protein [Argiope bruennichi]
MPKKKITYKKTFEVVGKVEAFYTTGKIQFLKNGNSILCLCDGRLKRFDIDGGKTSDAVENFEGEEIISFLLADDDDTLVTSTKNGFMRQWHLGTKVLEKGWKSGHIGVVNCMAFDSTTTLLATGGSDSTVKVWDIVRKYITHHLKGGKGVYSKVSIQKLGSAYHVFGAADDYEIHVWDLNTSQHVTALTGHYSTITDFVFFKENSRMFSCSRDKVVMLWDLTALKLLKTIPVYETVESCFLIPENLSLMDVSFNSSDTYFVTAGDKGVLRVWSTLSGKCIYEQTDSSIVLSENSDYQGPLIFQACYIPSLEAIAVVTFEHNVILYSVENFAVKNQFIGYIDDVLSVKFTGSKEDKIVVATNSSQIKIFQLPTFNCQLLKGHNDIVLCVDVFPKHKEILVSGSKDNNIKVWFLDSDSPSINSVYTGYGHTDSITAVCCCRSKARFFVSGSEDTTLKLWEVPESTPVVAVKLLLIPYKTVKAHDKLINAIDISDNDKFVASCSQDHTAKIWDSEELTLLGTLRGHKRGVWSVKFSPVDLAVVTSSGDETIRIWSLVDFSCLKTLQGHEASVLQVMFLTRGTQLLSSAADGNICLWDIMKSMSIKTLDEHKQRVWTLASSSSEEYFVSGGADSTVIVWKDTTETEKQEKLAEKEGYLLQEQELFNLVKQEKWTKALGLAISLDKPYQTYLIIEKILLQPDGKSLFEDVLHKMREDQKETLMKFSMEWITNSKRYYAGILVMNFIYRSYDSEELLKMPNMSKYIQEALPYLDRHYKRVQRRCQDMQIIKFLISQME